MATCTRPNRSDAHLSRDEEAKIEGETRDYFDGLAPRRHTKPQRSEYAAQYVDVLSADQDDGHTPEYTQFQHLEHNSEVCFLLLYVFRLIRYQTLKNY